RGRALQPRRPVATRDVPSEHWLTVPVPALVDESLFAAVNEQLEINRRHARQNQRGALLAARPGPLRSVRLRILRQGDQPVLRRGRAATIRTTVAWERMRIDSAVCGSA